ncbi:MAG: hypothetical protein H7249_10540 [Chitinophagaceae bacterium]|nr:hypothetical protein [Oligoflexus sp.]
MNRWNALSLVVLSLCAHELSAQPVVEAYDRFEMNWSNMRLRYFGESGAAKNLDVAEKEATDQGLLYALANIPKIRGEKGVSVENAENIAHAVSKQSYVFNTIYFSNGKVRVELDGSLALALDPGRKPYVKSSEGEAEAAADSETGSGVVIQVKGAKGPQLIGEIHDSGGDLVYSSQDVSPDAYRKNLIGRWFYKNSSELKSFAGGKPLTVEAEYRDGKLVVDKEAWAQVKKFTPKLLNEGRVAFVLPAVR